MRKALLPMIASLLLCGSATAALIATNARAAQSVRKPVMIAQAGPSELPGPTAPPPSQVGPAPEMMRDGPPPEILRARRAQFCTDLYARRVGQLAFLEAKLELTSAQQPLFDRWKQASLDLAKQHESDCSAPHEVQATVPNRRPSVIDFMNREEMRLKRRLADIEAMRPTLEAFYNSLAPAQQIQFGCGALMMMGPRQIAPFRKRMMLGMAGRQRPSEMGGMPMGSPRGAMPISPAQ